MAHNAYWVAEEYLRTPDTNPQVRKNAVTALAVIGSGESISRLVDVALTDKDAPVRERAMEEMLTLEGKPRDQIFALLAGALADPKTELRAYDALGRLRNISESPLPIPRQPFFRRIIRAWKLIPYLYSSWPLSSKSAQIALRAVKPAFKGSFLAAALYLTILMVTACAGGDTVGFAYLMLMMSFVVSLLVTMFTTPIERQPDHLASHIVEIGIAAVSSTVLSALYFDAISYNAYHRFTSGSVVVAVLAVVAARSGVLLASDVSLPRLKSRKVQALVGTAAGFLTFMLGGVVSFLVYPDGKTVLDEGFPVCAGMLVGIAYTAAVLSHEDTAARQAPRHTAFRVRRFLCAVLVLISLVFLVRAAFFMRLVGAFLIYDNGEADALSILIRKHPLSKPPE